MIDIFTDERIDHLNQADEFFQKKNNNTLKMFRHMKILNKTFSGPTSVRYLSSLEKFKRW
jgi:hypothetical protein